MLELPRTLFCTVRLKFAFSLHQRQTLVFQLSKVYTRIRYEVFFGTSTLVLVVVAVVVHFRREICISTRMHFASPPGDSPYYWKRAAMETVISAVETCLIAYAPMHLLAS